jgi:cell division protein FtsQ
VRISERQPIARIFTVQGESFYLDNNGLRLPLREKLSARVPVFTSFPSDKKKLSEPDSLLLSDLVSVGKFIVADSFWMSQVAQVDISPQGDFEIIPTIGDHTVSIGNADSLQSKFNRLYSFYKNAWLQNGINVYEKIDVQYNNQVVAIRKGSAKAIADSIKASQAMKNINSDTANVAALHEKVIEVRKDSARLAKPVIVTKTTGIDKKKNIIPVADNKTNKTTLSKVNQASPEMKKPLPKAVMKKVNG